MNRMAYALNAPSQEPRLHRHCDRGSIHRSSYHFQRISIPRLVPSQPYVTTPAPQWYTDIRTTPSLAHAQTHVLSPSALSSPSSLTSYASRPSHVHAASGTSPSASLVPPPAPRPVLAELPPLEDAPRMTPSPLLAELKVDLAWDVLDGLDISVAEEPATDPPYYSKMTLRADGFPWTVILPSSAKAISIGDVIQAIHGSLRVVVQENEFVKCNEQPKKDVRRIYFLRKKTVFVGLEAYREPEVWIPR
ncbi:hypothetical protein CPB85DRAFT_1314254 [Mucidula mucida]|nr:hypothetical protein CPB85DRAFT_1314254 [Mucidula mucida]